MLLFYHPEAISQVLKSMKTVYIYVYLFFFSSFFGRKYDEYSECWEGKRFYNLPLVLSHCGSNCSKSIKISFVVYHVPIPSDSEREGEGDGDGDGDGDGEGERRNEWVKRWNEVTNERTNGMKNETKEMRKAGWREIRTTLICRRKTISLSFAPSCTPLLCFIHWKPNK